MQHQKYGMWQCILCVPLFACAPNLSFAPTDKVLVVGGGVTIEVSRSGWSVWTTMISPLTCKIMIQIHFHKHGTMHTVAEGGHLTVYIQLLFIFFFFCKFNPSKLVQSSYDIPSCECLTNNILKLRHKVINHLYECMHMMVVLKKYEVLYATSKF